MWTKFYTEDGDNFETEIPIDYNCLITGDPSLDSKQEATLSIYQKNLISRSMKNLSFDPSLYWKEIPYHFNYGYAITCWKAQGSEYPYVLGYDCSWLKKKNPE
jgi:hypothetical protein